MSQEVKSYDDLKAEIIEMATKYKAVAKTMIPKLVTALKIENDRLTISEIKDIILKDFLHCWTRETIMNALGDEYKDKIKQDAGKKNVDARIFEQNKPIIMDTTGQPTMVTNVEELHEAVKEGLPKESLEILELKRDNEHLKKTIVDLREAGLKNAIETGDVVETNFDRLFEMLPSDDVDTFKNKSGTTLLFERLLVNFKYQKIPKLQWWVRVIK